MTEIGYDDIDLLRAVLVGRRIIAGVEASEGYESFIKFTLDDGTILKAITREGCGGCMNGHFPVEAGDGFPNSIITDVDVDESGGAITMFVYSEGIPTALFSSAGEDNGYYGWGHRITVEHPGTITIKKETE